MVKIGEISSCVGIVTTTLLWILSMSMKEVSGLGCFVCSSVNGSDPSCEDTFNSTVENYVQMCKAGRKGRGGLFPGTECIKLKAHNSSFTVLVRGCSVHSGDLTSDTEMGGVEECALVNRINYDGQEMYGCVVSCLSDGCNQSNAIRPGHVTLCMSAIVVLLRMLSS